jgi:hypothetical protein
MEYVVFSCTQGTIGGRDIIPQLMFRKKGEGHRKSTLIKIVQIGKIFFVTKNLENTNNILMTKKSRMK